MSSIKASLDKRLLCQALFATSPKTPELVSDKQGLTADAGTHLFVLPAYGGPGLSDGQRAQGSLGKGRGMPAYRTSSSGLK